MSTTKRKRVLAIASGGGHWVQLMRLRRAFDDTEVAYVCVKTFYAEEVPGSRFYAIPDATRWSKHRFVGMALKLLWILLRERPHVVVTTGSAPGYLCLRLAQWFGSKTVWIDSIANAEEISLSGRKAAKVADLWLTQWEHLASADGPQYHGATL